MKQFREYRIKAYLNARHFIYINGNQGSVHPHTWEFILYMRFPNNEFIEFTDFEKAINNYLEKFQNKVINNIEPFDTIIPTLENITDSLSSDFFNIITDMNGLLIKIEASETPTRTYIVNILDDVDFQKEVQDYYNNTMSIILDRRLDKVLK